MKRDARLHELSSDHHHALVLARRIDEGAADAPAVRARFDAELAPHFAIEEEVLLPGLRAIGLSDLAARVAAEHVAIRGALTRAEGGDAGALVELASLLRAHVRFEERALFPACEQRLPTSVLDEVARRGRSSRNG